MSDFIEMLCDTIAQESGMTAEEVRAASGLMSQGFLDSFALVTVISMVEDHLGIQIEPRDLTFANFDSLAAIAAFVEASHVAG